MPSPLLAPPLPSGLDPRTEEFAENRAAMLEKLEEIDRLLDEAEQGGGAYHHERLARRGKLPVRERLHLALDPDSPFLEISPLAGYNSDFAIGGGAVLGIGVIAGIECVIFANDPTVLGGALTPYVAKKWMRALEIARDNRMPYVSFVESAGADLRRGGSRKQDDDEERVEGVRRIGLGEERRVEHGERDGRVVAPRRQARQDDLADGGVHEPLEREARFRRGEDDAAQVGLLAGLGHAFQRGQPLRQAVHTRILERILLQDLEIGFQIG